MPIRNYIRPQTEIYQQLEVTIDEVGSQMATCVIGPNYALYRYGKEELPATTYKKEGAEIPYVFHQEFEYDYSVDTSYVKVYAEGLQASIAEFNNKLSVDKSNLTVLRLNAVDDSRYELFASANGEHLAQELKGYGVQIGDKLLIDQGDGVTPRVRTVLDIVGKRIPAIVTVSTDNLAGEESTVKCELTSKKDVYTATKSTVYLLSVETKSGDADKKVLKITDTTGLDVMSYVDVQEGQEFEVGTFGVKAKISNVNSLKEGQSFSISCVAEMASTTEFDGLLLDAMPVTLDYLKEDAAAKLHKVTLMKEYSGEVCAAAGINAPYTVDGEKVTINPDLALFIEDQQTFAYFRDDVGKLFVQFRVLIIPQEDEEKFTLHNDIEVQTAFGTIDQDNDIAYACHCALQGAALRAIYAIRVRGLEEINFMEAAQKSQADRDMYSYAVITDNEDCARAVAEYNVTLCAPDVKMWRRTLWGVDPIGEYTAGSTDNNGLPIRATFSDITGDSNSTNNTLVQIAEDTDLDLKAINFNGLLTTMRRGDVIQLSVNGERYLVKEVLSSKELLLDKGPKTEITTPVEISLIHADTPLNRREFVQQVCTRFNSLRKTVVWSDGATFDGEIIKNKYLAAYIAGLASAVVPQQSMTHSEVTIVDNASRTYTLYSREELDDIAKYGCLVVAQDTKGSPCYVRHNLTTETDKGLLYYEESCIRNIDSMSYMTDDTISHYIGRANVTPSALRSIYRDLNSLYTRLTNNSTDDLIGPQLVRFSDLTVKQDPTLKSRVLVNVKWYVPAPLNNIRVYEMAFVADVDEVNAESYAAYEASIAQQ